VRTRVTPTVLGLFALSTEHQIRELVGVLAAGVVILIGLCMSWFD